MSTPHSDFSNNTKCPVSLLNSGDLGSTPSPTTFAARYTGSPWRNEARSKHHSSILTLDGSAAENVVPIQVSVYINLIINIQVNWDESSVEK